MVFDNIFPELTVESDLERLAGCAVRYVPFNDCQEHTSYYISRDGKNVFVGIAFSGYVQTKKVKIIKAGVRSRNSAPCFMRRNRNGMRCYASIPSAVYGAFVLGDRMPNFRLIHLDGNLNNTRLDNLSMADDSMLGRNLRILEQEYARNFHRLVNICLHFRKMRVEQAEDFVSDAFIRLCLSRNELKDYNVLRLWIFMIKEAVLSFRERNRLDYEIFDLLENAFKTDGGVDSEAGYSVLWSLIPKECTEAVSLVLSGYTQKEIAKELGCSQAWVNALLKKAKKALCYDQ